MAYIEYAMELLVERSGVVEGGLLPAQLVASRGLQATLAA